MTKEDFEINWNSTFPNTLPISHTFKIKYVNRWFRIHSLPKSKRYAENEKEWIILLKRQNQIITDLFVENTEILIVTGEYNWGEREDFVNDEEEIFKPYNFIRLDKIDLFELNSDEYDENEIFKPAFAEIKWESNKYDNLLRGIADEKVIAFFVSFDKKVIVAPYDGGIDFIIKDNKLKEFYKEKYKDWLSEREDGL